MWNYTQDIQWFYMNGILEIKQQIGKSSVCPSDNMVLRNNFNWTTIGPEDVIKAV